MAETRIQMLDLQLSDVYTISPHIGFQKSEEMMVFGWAACGWKERWFGGFHIWKTLWDIAALWLLLRRASVHISDARGSEYTGDSHPYLDLEASSFWVASGRELLRRQDSPVWMWSPFPLSDVPVETSPEDLYFVPKFITGAASWGHLLLRMLLVIRLLLSWEGEL